MLSTNLVQTNLRTKFLGQHIEYFTRLKSTNEEAWELADNGAKSGTIIITDNQFGGKGRDGRVWLAVPNKGLSFSILVEKKIPAKLSGWLPILAGLSINKALSNFDIDISLKWPNDITLDGRKVGGVLCESKIKGELVYKAVIGIGLNINESKEELDPCLESIATSLHIHSEKFFQRERILAQILNEIEPIIEKFPENINSIQTDWSLNCSHLDKKIEFNRGSKRISGIFKGLGEDGSAILKVDQSELEFYSGEIQ
ncbi:uncharacterized protein METZ01_LOCUS84900 [marine metagenome]|uniref:BPL/LPL catalytic domain-containing protein n=1 Tax=marine metagenome TaxID=408172 RepID=A0A381UV76_9ZZZZ